MMRAELFARLIPVVFAMIGVFLLTYWLTGHRKAGDVGRRWPTQEQAHSSNTPGAAAPTAPSTAAAPPAAGAGGATSGTTSQTTAPTLAGAWPRFRGAHFDNISTDPTPLARSWSSGLRQYWSIELGEGYASAAVLNSRVYLLDYDQQARADVLRCLAFANGQELWRRSYPANVKRNHGMSRTVPAVTEKYVVTLGPLCNVLCADAQTGDVRWQLDLVRDYGTQVPPWYAGQCPLIDGDCAIIAPGGKALMIAVDLATGKVRWQTPNPRGWRMTHSSIIPMTVQGQRMYVYCASDGVVGVSAKDGSLLWETTDWRVSTATVPVPVPIGDGRIFITGGYNAGSIMLKLNAEGGRFTVQTLFRLSAKVFSSDQQSPILYKDHIYGVIAGGTLVCLDLHGNKVWDSGGERFGLGPYLIADGMIYLLNDKGMLTLAEASPSEFRVLGKAQIIPDGREAWGPLALAGGRLIARDLTRMVCVDVAKR